MSINELFNIYKNIENKISEAPMNSDLKLYLQVKKTMFNDAIKYLNIKSSDIEKIINKTNIKDEEYNYYSLLDEIKELEKKITLEKTMLIEDKNNSEKYLEILENDVKELEEKKVYLKWLKSKIF